MRENSIEHVASPKGICFVQKDSSTGDIWIADSGASCHMIHNKSNMYDIKPPPPDLETIRIGDRRRLNVE